MTPFQIESKFKPQGDQPKAIEGLVRGLESDHRFQTLLGVTGSGKTFTIANVIEKHRRPTLLISHNKTLAAQLYSELKGLFPKNAVHYFVSYYDYYQPEAYIPQRDIYIEKDADINEDIDRLRLAATSALVSRPDTIVVASVSCIYGLGAPEDYMAMMIPLSVGLEVERDQLLRKLVDVQYERTDIELIRGKFRVRGETIEVVPAYQESGLRIRLDGNRVESLAEIDSLTGDVIRDVTETTVFPAKHFVMPEKKIAGACDAIRAELDARLTELRKAGKLVEAQRLEARTKYDLELLLEVGYCKGIENYSRHLTGRKPGERPSTLIDYFPKGFLTVVDESHQTIPQIHGMFNGDRARKETLVEYGFRLPSALDNRPMRFEEWLSTVHQAIFVSATPGVWEIRESGGRVVEQVIRPTGLVDPAIEVRPAKGQVADLLVEIKKRAERNERALVTTLTKRLAEDLANYLTDEGIKGRYLHSEVHTIERVQILRELREGKFDCLVGVNLLREGLDLPEVTLVAILDADKEGFLRSETSIIQTIGRTARNVNGRVILYADVVTPSLERAIRETTRRRELQTAHNQEHGITPKTIEKEIRAGIEEEVRVRSFVRDVVHLPSNEYEKREMAGELEKEMFEAAERLEFERAAELRDMIRRLRGEAKPGDSTSPAAPRGRGRRAKT